MPLSTERKCEYFDKMKGLLTTYTKAFVVEVDNVGSFQLQKTRLGLRGKGEILMGKNTMMRKCIKDYVNENPGTPCEKMVSLCQGNVGFVFTNDDLGEVREVLESNVRPAPARVGAIAPVKVVVPKGPTGCDPGQTGFFQTLQIGTKITKGQIEIVNDIDLIQEGEKVTASQAALLQKLGIEPFTYGLLLKMVYDNGSLFEPKVLDITDDVLGAQFTQAVAALAAFSLGLGYPTMASIPHSIANAFKVVLSVTLACDNYSFPQADVYREYLADPSKFAVATGGDGGGGDAAEEEEEKEEEKEEEEEMDLGGGMDMFGGEEGDGDY